MYLTLLFIHEYIYGYIGSKSFSENEKKIFSISASSPSTTSGQSAYPMAFRTNGTNNNKKMPN